MENTNKDENMTLKRQNALLKSSDTVEQLRETIKTVLNENNRLKDQLMSFVTETQNEKKDKNGITDQDSVESADHSDSLYQMLQEYMVENQSLKNENEQLKHVRNNACYPVSNAFEISQGPVTC